ncbi:MAG: thiamine phosphate synthase [Cetobacterium somerae]|uniref:thiamine phosphate synthase n=1 Tax=Cetobacterium TaxID=180162 RepID=UPI00163CA688|nr:MULTISPECIES: thiamine phosphate synthase [Cetobacterium]MBC2854778.1 thiamine phosphate synthase [Cetobacterium sp. 2G large]MCQ9627692.1 thiamine phosphate synthase [Cetobacterium somerae]
MKKFDLPIGVYAITDSKSGKNKEFLEYCEDLLKGGAKIIQYREKKRDLKLLLEEAKALRELTLKYNATFIVNDYLDIALLSEADGIHIGQDDLPIKDVRKILGENKIIGISTHNPQEAQQAIIDGADYIGVGPIFYTETKEDVCAPVTLEYLDFVNKNIKLPYVAIGGIKENNIDKVLAMGAKSICLVSELVGADNTLETTKRINNIIKHWHKN